jgi:hypothetical protein
MARVFERCGWSGRGSFDPTGPLSREATATPVRAMNEEDDDESLGFRVPENLPLNDGREQTENET